MMSCFAHCHCLLLAGSSYTCVLPDLQDHVVKLLPEAGLAHDPEPAGGTDVGGPSLLPLFRTPRDARGEGGSLAKERRGLSQCHCRGRGLLRRAKNEHVLTVVQRRSRDGKGDTARGHHGYTETHAPRACGLMQKSGIHDRVILWCDAAAGACACSCVHASARVRACAYVCRAPTWSVKS
jgi:hypothetical protein